nr:hypothetical protein Iba_chr03aCG12630 [Ipomoea batatas]GMC72438.1 hypothetical protein Iba_chr03bCG11490 [Ipomoea batatas]GMC74528.1 hypothetical protein Iba_chr03cCG11110 [Ipomoea batatas]
MICLSNLDEGCSASATTMFPNTLPTAKNLSAVVHMYSKPISSRRIFCTMGCLTVFESSLPISIVRRQSGIISVDRRKLITSLSSTFTRAPMTPKLVSLRYSKGLDLLVVLRKGYKYSGI